MCDTFVKNLRDDTGEAVGNNKEQDGEKMFIKKINVAAEKWNRDVKILIKIFYWDATRLRL